MRFLGVMGMVFGLSVITYSNNAVTVNVETFKYKNKTYTQNVTSNCISALGRRYCPGPSQHRFDLDIRERHRYDNYDFYDPELGNLRLNQGTLTTDPNQWAQFLNSPSIFESDYTNTDGGSATFTFSTMRHRFYGHFYNCGYLRIASIDANGQCKINGELPSNANTTEVMVGRLDFQSSDDYNSFRNIGSYINRFNQIVTENLTFNFMKYYISELEISPPNSTEVLTMLSFFNVWMHDKIYPHSFYHPDPGVIPSVVDANIEQFMIDVKLKYKLQTASGETVIIEFPFIETQKDFPYVEDQPEYIVQRFFFEVFNDGASGVPELKTYLMSHKPGEPDDIYDSRYYPTHEPQQGTYTFDALLYLASDPFNQFKIRQTFNNQTVLLNLVKDNLINQPQNYAYFEGSVNLAAIDGASSTIKMPPDFFHKLFSSNNLEVFVRDSNNWVSAGNALRLNVSPTGGVSFELNGEGI